MEFVGKLLAVGAAGAATFWSAIPVGIALGLHPILAGLVATLGNLASVVLVAVLEGRLRQWIPRYGRFTTQEDRLKRVWSRYGLVGVALLSPLITGAPLGTALALVLGAPVRRLIPLMIVSVVVWGVGLTVATTFGFDGLLQLRRM
jgi:Putative small multi-drug export protein